MRSFDRHPTDSRFVLVQSETMDPPPPITRLNLVHNWFAELERLAPTGP